MATKLRLPRLTGRTALVILHDLVMTGAALLAAFYLRFDEDALGERAGLLFTLVGPFALCGGLVYFGFDLYRSKWRFASLPDLMNIAKAATVLAVLLLVVDYLFITQGIYGAFFSGRKTIGLYWLLQMFLLGGPRLAYRYFRYTRVRVSADAPDSVPVLLLGRAADAEMLLRSIESGAVRKLKVTGILSPSAADRSQVLRGVEVLGSLDDLERTVADLEEQGIRVARLVLTASALAPEARPESILMRARRLQIGVSRLPSMEAGEPVRLAPVAVEDLLLRPSVTIDLGQMQAVVGGRSVLVTGGGGSIGSEICRRIASFGAARLIVAENSEPALHEVTESLAALRSGCEVHGHIADIRDRRRMFDLCAAFRPDIVFHAAALKHVPILERDWAEAIKTNVFGSINVADAAAASGAAAMVMISTDKAIEPVSVLGATKRLAEMYCQALDASLAGRPRDRRMRILAVRFGNVLASNGSVVPKFKAQIEAGGPVTVTHRDMVRYFMTIREACDLVVTATGHALGDAASDVAVYVLKMGQQVRILDLAERMIRLSGLEPGIDIDIAFTGIRPGERLHEILFAEGEPTFEIGVAGIAAARPVSRPLADMLRWAEELERVVAADDRAAAFKIFADALPDFGAGPAGHAERPSDAQLREDGARHREVPDPLVAVAGGSA